MRKSVNSNAEIKNMATLGNRSQIWNNFGMGKEMVGGVKGGRESGHETIPIHSWGESKAP
jgi:hypothetical protein